MHYCLGVGFRAFVGNVLTLPFHCRMLFYFSSLGYVHVNLEEALGKLVLVALAATVVECIPVTDVVDDNISVPLATILVASVLFGSSAH
jgi:phytol kinase